MLTSEQQACVEAIHKHSSLAIIAKAGTGKTYTLQQIVKSLKPSRGLYLAYNKAISLEASEKFPTSIECRTIHALAYRYTNYNIGKLDYDTIKSPMSNYAKSLIISALEEFFNSSSLDAHKFLDSRLNERYVPIAIDVLDNMYNDTIPASFGFMLKMFHIGLSDGSISIPKYDIIMLDEAGDTNEVIVEIYKLLNADKKVMVGDPYQNIYAFNHTVDGFKLIDSDVTLPLSTSFRCTEEVASKVSIYCDKYLEKGFQYHGVAPESKIETVAFISRSNATIIRRIMKICNVNGHYNTTRPLGEIFSMPLAIHNITHGNLKYVNTARYMNFIKEYKKFKESNYKCTFYAYLADEYKHDIQISGACKILEELRSKGKSIFNVYAKAREHLDTSSTTILTTAHACKGLEFDEVYIENNMNETVLSIIEEGGPKDAEEMSELNLYYVTCTRAKYRLVNAELCER